MTAQLRAFALVLSLFSLMPAGQDVRALESGKAVEREIAGGESQGYQISLVAGQFVRIRLDQRAIDTALIVTAPDGKRLVDMNLTRAGQEESLSLEAAVNGDYRLTVRGGGLATLHGAYRLEAAVQAAVTEQDRKRLTAEALMIEADILSNQGGKASAQVIDKEQQALAVWRELGESSWAAYTLYMIGYAYDDLSQISKAVDYFEQALALYREAKNLAGEGGALNALGNASFSLSRYEKAAEYYENALAIRRGVKDRTGEGSTLGNLGNVYLSMGRYEKAINTYEQALALAREVRDRKAEGNALHGLGASYVDMGSSEKGIAYQEQVLAIAREVKNRAGEGDALTGLGNISFGMGDYEKSIGYHDQVLAIRRDMKDRLGEGTALINLGNVYVGLGNYEKGIEYFEQALAIAREVKNRTREGSALNNLGLTYSLLGRNEKAVDAYEQALVIAREVKDRAGEGKTLSNLGYAHLLLAHYDKAIEYQERALAIAREIKNRLGEGKAFSTLGNVYLSRGPYEKAIECHEQALAIYREVKHRNGESTELTNLGDAYLNLRQYEKAIDAYQQSLAIRRDMNDRAGLVYTLTNWARAERAQNKLLAARAHVEESLKIAESMRADLLSPESRASFLASVQSSYQLCTDLLMRQHQAEPAKGFDALAVEVSERQRARSLLDLLTEARADLRWGVDPALIERERSVGRQLNDKAQRLTQASQPEHANALKKEISQLETDYERTQAAIRKANPHYSALVQPQPLKLKEIQQQLDADTLLLEYALGEDRSYVWAITRNSLASYELPKEEQIKQSALQVHELLTARSANKRGESAIGRLERIAQAEEKLPAAAASLSQTLLAPVEAQLGNKRLVIVADGVLQYIPFSMLPEPVGSRQLAVGSEKQSDRRPSITVQRPPLIVGHEIVSLPSASALAIQRAELAGRPHAPKMLAVIADPVFDRTDARFTKTATEGNEKQAAQTIASDDSRSIEHLAVASDENVGTTRRLLIPRLPFTREEAARLLALTPKDSSFGAIDFQASRTTALDPALGQYRYLHVATHGYLDTERPGLSALLFSMVDAQGRSQNGFLRANDIYNLKLPAELVVLSACQTGLGKEIKGEGLVGLTRGFMYAGAARVVVSLWNVNDKATAELMTKFYRRMLKQGERPAAALRAAQVEMWKQKQWQSPYYWAGFTMQGEWR